MEYLRASTVVCFERLGLAGLNESLNRGLFRALYRGSTLHEIYHVDVARLALQFFLLFFGLWPGNLRRIFHRINSLDLSTSSAVCRRRVLRLEMLSLKI